MDLTGVHAFLHALDGKVQELGIQTNYVEGISRPQIGDTLRILMAVTKEGHPVVTEFMITEMAADYDLLIIYSTVLAKLGKRGSELPQKLLEWNILSPMGHYGIYEEENQLYHKYSMPIPVDTDPEALAEKAMDLLGLIYEQLSAQYTELAEYSVDAD